MKFIYIALISVCFGLNVFAQAKIKVLKYKAPKFSPATATVGVQGEFSVIAQINKDGKVISVKSDRTHPLLIRILEEAASKWKFSADKNSEKREVKIFFEYVVKVDDSVKNVDKTPTEKSRFEKPFRIIITRTVYLMV